MVAAQHVDPRRAEVEMQGKTGMGLAEAGEDRCQKAGAEIRRHRQAQGAARGLSEVGEALPGLAGGRDDLLTARQKQGSRLSQIDAPGVRSSSLAPGPRSSSAFRREREEAGRVSRAAAAEKLRARATSTKRVMSRRSSLVLPVEKCAPIILIYAESGRVFCGAKVTSDRFTGERIMQDDDFDHSRLHPARRGFLTGSVAAAAGALALASVTHGAEAAAAEPTAGEVVSKDNAAILLIDHQDKTVSWIASQPASQPQKMVVANVRMLARLSSEMGIPLLVISTMEGNIGSNIKDIQETAPAAYAARVKRGGTLNCFLDAAFAKAVAGLGRKRLIMAGLTTDICLLHSALRALALGYEVMVVADACGSMSALADEVTFDRLRANGAVVTVADQALTSLYTDFGSAEGQQAMQINLQEVVSKMGK